MTSPPTEAEQWIAQAVAAWRGGRPEIARSLAEQAWTRARDGRAAAILARIELDAGRTAGALEWTLRGADAAPGDARLRQQAGRLHFRLGDIAAARRAFEAATSLDPGDGTASLELGACCERLGDLDAALLAYRRAARTSAQRDVGLQAYVNALAAAPESAAAPASPPAAAREPLSIVTCSVDDARFERAAASYRVTLGDWPHEIVRVTDARSLAEGYTRGLARVTGALVAFSHDDVEVLVPDLGARLARHLAECDIVGIAGATRAAGPAWFHAGPPALHGLVVYPASGGFEVNCFSAEGPLVRGIEALDGVWMAMRRDTALAVGWDARTFDGFHGYDVDFTLRAAAQGCRVAVAVDLGIVHHSRGTFGAAWHAAADALARKHPALDRNAAGEPTAVAIRVESAARVRAICARLGALPDSA